MDLRVFLKRPAYIFLLLLLLFCCKLMVEMSTQVSVRAISNVDQKCYVEQQLRNTSYVCMFVSLLVCSYVCFVRLLLA